MLSLPLPLRVHVCYREEEEKKTNECGEVSVAQAPLYLKAIWSSLFVFVSISFKSVAIEAIDYIY